MSSRQLVLDILARDKTKAGLSSATKNAKGLSTAMKGIGIAAAAAGVIAFGRDSVKTFQSATKETLTLNRAIGGTVEDSSRLRFAAKMSGQDMEKFTKGMGLLSKNLVKASQDSGGTLAKSLRGLGVQFTDASGKVRPLATLLPDLAETFSKMQNGPEKTALALQLFGRNGMALLPFLNRGSAGIKQLMQDTDKFNQVIGDEQAKKFAESVRIQREFDASLQGLKMTVGEDLLPAMTAAMPAFSQLVRIAADGLNAFTSLPAPVQTLALGLVAAGVASDKLGGAFGLLRGVTSSVRALIVGKTVATVADTAATRANTSAQVANSAALGKVGKAGKLGGLASGGGFASAAAGAAGVAGTILAAGTAFHVYSTNVRNAADGNESLADVARRTNGALTEQSRAAADAWLKQNNLTSVYRQAGVSMDTVRLAVMGNTAAYNEVRAGLSRAEGATRGYTSSGAAASGMLNTQGAAFSKLGDQINQAYESTKEFNNQIRATPAVQLRMDISELQKQRQQAVAALQSLHHMRPSPAVRLLTQDAKNRVADIDSKINKIRQRIPVTPKVNANPAVEAVRKLQSFLNMLKDKNIKIKTEHIDINRVINTPAGGETPVGFINKKATGGRSAGLTWVGERGPELVTLPPGSHVFTHSQSMRMTGAATAAKGKKGKPPLSGWWTQQRKWADTELQKMKDKVSSWRSESASAIAQTRGFAGIGGFDMGARSTAQQEVADALAEVNRSTVGSTERANAMSRLQAARSTLAGLPASAKDWLKGRVEKLKRWKSALTKLSSSWGKTAGGQQLMREIFDQGPEGGLELAEELLRNPADLKDMATLAAEASTLATQAGAVHPSTILAGQGQKQVETLQTVILQIDGRQLHKALLTLKRAQGNKALGLG